MSKLVQTFLFENYRQQQNKRLSEDVRNEFPESFMPLLSRKVEAKEE